MLDRLLGLFSRDIGIDLGTANTLVHVRGRGIVISEPSRRRDRREDASASRDRRRGEADGRPDAGQHHRDPPAPRRRHQRLRRDRADDQVLRATRCTTGSGMIPRPRMLLGIPSGVTEVEKRAVRDAALNAGARWARLIEEPMAAAIGAGLPVSEPSVADRRHRRRHDRGRRHLASAASSSPAAIRIGGDEMDQDIVPFARREYNLFLGERTAEDIKIAIGSAYPGDWDAQRVDAPRPRPPDRACRAAVEVGARPDPRGDRAVRRADRRDGQGHDRGDAAGARRRHHGPGHRPRRRRRPARGPRPAGRRGDADAGPRGRRPADLRRPRHGHRARGARPDGPGPRRRHVRPPAERNVARDRRSRRS